MHMHLITSLVAIAVLAYLRIKGSLNQHATRGIIHVTVGIPGEWEPTAEELETITKAFQHAASDPEGAVIATRTGVVLHTISNGLLLFCIDFITLLLTFDLVYAYLYR